MRNENVTIDYLDLERMFNIISNLRNEVISKNQEEELKREKEEQQEPLSFGYLTTYQKQDGSLFQKRTKYRPYDYSFHSYYQVGDENSFGHKVISIVEDRQLNLGQKIDINKKWYV